METIFALILWKMSWLRWFSQGCYKLVGSAYQTSDNCIIVPIQKYFEASRKLLNAYVMRWHGSYLKTACHSRYWKEQKRHKIHFLQNKTIHLRSLNIWVLTIDVNFQYPSVYILWMGEVFPLYPVIDLIYRKILLTCRIYFTRRIFEFQISKLIER